MVCKVKDEAEFHYRTPKSIQVFHLHTEPFHHPRDMSGAKNFIIVLTVIHYLMLPTVV